jgi:phage tail-like protein
VVRGLRVLAPRPSLLSWLPALFSQGDPVIDPPGANFLERFLSLFEGQLTAMEAALDSVQRLLNPQAADDKWLAFVAAWIDLAFDPSWPEAARRQLVIEGAALQAGAGTPAAMARYLEIYTGAAAGIVESFRRAPPAPIQLGARGALGVAPLAGAETAGLAHDFTVHVTLPQGRDRAASLSAIDRIVETVKPAHTTWRLATGGGAAGRIGLDTAVDGTVIAGPWAADPCDRAAGDDLRPGGRDTDFRLGGRLGHPLAPALSEGVGR